MRIKTVLLLILILLQLPSCNKRYVFLRKVRVEHTSAKEISKETSKKTVKTETIETASADSSTYLIERPSFSISKEKILQYKQNQPTKLQPKNDIQPEPNKDSLKRHQHLPDKQAKNVYALLAFILTLAALTSISLFFIYPVAAFFVVLILAISAMFYGKEAYKELYGTANKRKWMAITGIVAGIALIVFVLITSVSGLILSSPEKSIIIPGSILWVLISSFVLLLSFPALKKRSSERIKPEDSEPHSPSHKTNKCARASIILLILTILSLLIVAATLIALPVLSVIFLAISCILATATIILGTVGLKQIKTKHEEGKWMALIGILGIAALLILALIL